MNTKKLRDSIKNHLVKKGNYEPDIDDYNIDILIDNLEFAALAKRDLDTNGLIVTIPNGNGIATTKQNPALGAYHMSIKLVKDSAHTLSINRQDRLKLKIEEANKATDLAKLKELYK